MAYIESHQELGNHPKTKRAARLLGVCRVQFIGHLHYLWWWALDYAEDGDLSRFSDEEIARGAEWEGDPAEFVAALRGAGFLDRDQIIHDWCQYTGRFLAERRAHAAREAAARAANAERQRRHRERKRNARVTGTKALRADPVTPNVTLRNALRNVTKSVTPALTDPAYASAPASPGQGVVVVVDVVKTTTTTTEGGAGGNRPAPRPIHPVPKPSSSSPSKPKRSHQPNGAAASGYVAALNGAWPQVRADFGKLDPELTAGWLRKALAGAETRAGPLAPERVVAGLELAILKIDRALANPSPEHPIRNVGGLAAAIVAEALEEQGDAG